MLWTFCDQSKLGRIWHFQASCYPSDLTNFQLISYCVFHHIFHVFGQKLKMKPTKCAEKLPLSSFYEPQLSISTSLNSWAAQSRANTIFRHFSAFHAISVVIGGYLWVVSKFFQSCHQCTICCLDSMFTFQPKKLRYTLRFVSWYAIYACLVGRQTLFSRKRWLSNSKFAISGHFDQFWVFQK